MFVLFSERLFQEDRNPGSYIRDIEIRCSPPPSFMIDKRMDDPKIVSIPQHVVSKIRENAKNWDKKISFFN